ncbi:MAG: hypothetical protein Q6J18_05895, partial [Gloeomargarita sp. DG02_3_bins_56]
MDQPTPGQPVTEPAEGSGFVILGDFIVNSIIEDKIHPRRELLMSHPASPVVLVILDGWGYREDPTANA